VPSHDITYACLRVFVFACLHGCVFVCLRVRVFACLRVCVFVFFSHDLVVLPTHVRMEDFFFWIYVRVDWGDAYS